MALDPNIALQVKPMELANPLAQYGQIAQIQNAANQNALAQYQLGAAQRAETRDVARMNALAAAGTDPTAVANALIKAGDVKGYTDFVNAQLTRQKTQSELLDSSLKRSREFLSGVETPEQYIAWHQANHADPVLGPALAARGVTPEQTMQTIQTALQTPGGFQELKQRSMLSVDKFAELNKPHWVNANGVSVPVSGLTGREVPGVQRIEDVPLPAAVEAQKVRIAAAGKPVTNITNVQERAEAGERGKMLVNQYGDISKAAGLAIKTLPSIEANLSALNKGLDTGFGTEAKAAGARILGALGVQGAEKLATDTQTFQSNAIQAVLQKQLEQKGPQTESDARRIEQVGAELGKTKDANRFILSMAKEQLRRDVDQRNFYDRWYKTNKTYDGAEDAWFAGEGGKSLFDRPALKKYASGAAAPASAVNQIPTPSAAPAAPAARTVVRTGTLNNRRVVQYSDGSTEYAD